MLNRPNISAFASGTVRVGDALATAEPLWIEPYTAVGITTLFAGGLDVYASFDGQSYSIYAPGVFVDQAYMRCWKARIPARWLKFVGRETVDAQAMPDGTILQWGAKS
jgi:hypothetical protein